jgi:hydrogenase nickel incorporation protein HypA/HybF
MHELSVTESILEIAATHARENNASKVTQINLVIGRLSSIIDDSVQFYWEAISEGSICEGSKLSFTRTSAVLRCTDCQHEYQIEIELTPCPHCGSYQTQIIGGEEFYVESIVIEKDQENK